MPATALVKPTSKPLKTYFDDLHAFADQDVDHEMAVRSAFQNLLADTARMNGWLLIPELSLPVGGKTIRPDGTLRDGFNLPRGYWEAKDSADRLDDEIRKKAARGYPLTNTIFEDTQHGALFQDGRELMRADLRDPQQLADLLNQFYAHTQPDIESFEQAVAEFKERVPDLASGLAEKIAAAHRDNTKFQAAYAAFFELCKTALNPNISPAAVDEMLIQHLLTERLIRRIFDNPDFRTKNVIAAEVEKVIEALVSHSFSRAEYMRSLDRFYLAIEDAARGLEDFGDKQQFLNTIYERFFQGYSVKVADTHGIVYTPQPIVDFMCQSVVETLHKEFGKGLGDPEVVIIDPATGTGSFVVNLLRRADKRDLPDLYKNRLFANEVMLMPYYIAALNIEHAYYELTGQYEPFEGLCFVDTLDLAEGAQMQLGFMTEANSARVERQNKAPITVIIGNPPYNVGQLNENDNNKNRKYAVVDGRIRDTYARDSKASNKNALSDAYVKFFRWASDRLGTRPGIVCLVTNNGFLRGVAFDGFRKNLAEEFDRIFHFDFRGNARTTGNLRQREGGNIFDDAVRVGIGLTLAVRTCKAEQLTIHYHVVPDYLSAEEKRTYLAAHKSVSVVEWQPLAPDSRHTWLVPENADEFAAYVPIGNKDSKEGRAGSPDTVFTLYSGGVKTNRDDVVSDFDRETLAERVGRFVGDYNAEVDRYKRADKPADVDSFVRYDYVKWSRDLKQDLQRQRYASFEPFKLRALLYRPFSKRTLFFDPILNEEIYVLPRIFPTPTSEQENQIICCTSHSQMPFSAQITNCIPSLDVGGRPGQCFPFYVYDTDGTNRRENITDWALKQFQAQYGDPTIAKWDVFYYVYGVLHHPGYRAKFADNLKRELPRIPFAPDFRAVADAGRALADLHLNYETVTPYPLHWIEAKDKPLSYRVEKMRLSRDKTALQVNETLTLADIPPEVYDYRLGNRSALEWVIDQYQVSTDKRSGITSDPNRPDDPRYIVDLVGRVVAVSLETVRIVRGLPEDYAALTP